MNQPTRTIKIVLQSALLLGVVVNSQAAVTDLATTPLVVSSSSALSVQPNVFLMMDDSGSMAWDYMPDDVSAFSNGYGYNSSQCNGIYYDPTLTYIPPVTSAGTSYANATFTAAWNDGYNTAGGSTNLSTSFATQGGGGGGGAPAYYYKYSGTQNTLVLKNYYNTASTFYKECVSNVGSAPGSGVFTKVVVSATSGPGGTDERTNFANWYSYYRTRINMMKTATGLAFNPLTSNYRVGFGTMNNNGGAKFLNLASFNATQRTAWYNMLYSTSAGSSTPLLGALANVGLMYANKLTSINGVAVTDPVQYSCQQNFAILSTDGFWNSQTGNLQLDLATPVGEQDGNEIRPMYDGAAQTTQTATPTTTVVQTQTVQNTTTTTPSTRTITTLGASCSVPGATLPTTCIQSNSSGGTRTWCMESDANNGTECQPVGTGTTNICRGVGSKSNLPGGVDLPCVTDSGGTKWCLFTNNTSAGTSSCVSNGYALYACAVTAAVNGTSVTTQTQTMSQQVTGATTTVQNATTVVTSTYQTVNGQNQPASSSTVGPTISIVSGPTTAATSTTTSNWVNSGGATTSCMANPPAAGTSAAVAGTPTTTNNGAATVTTLSTLTTVGAPVTTTVSTSGGSSDTLSDVAEYYYVNDLRTTTLGNCASGSGSGQTLCSNATPDPYNNVPPSGLDGASWQHMTTFTLGLGARGNMVFSPTYLTDTSGDFFAVKNGLSANASAIPPICSWQANGTTCNWPLPVSNTQTTVDDLWHAAVDGRGTYFSATNPATLATGISTALAGVTARTGAAAAATTSNPNVTSGDNFVFSSTFVSQNWYGELVEQQLDLTTGAVLPAINWSAQAQLDGNASRTIYTYSAAAANGLQAFTAANFGANAFFNAPNIASLSQLCTGTVNCLPVWLPNNAYAVGSEYRNGTTWYHVNTAYTSGATFGATDTAKATVVAGAAGVNLVNYLAGDRSNEGALSDTTKYFRQRLHLLGDIVNAEAVYVKAPQLSFADMGYGNFIAAQAARQSMVYVAANDGMLHAFYAASDMMDVNGKVVTTGGTNVVGGNEAWAYIPSAMLPNLYKLADKNYANQHQYYVDGTPVRGDICVSNCTLASATWKSIVVGGMNGGGRGYYALDVSNPASPQALWEFTNTNMGYTYGNPVIAKLSNGTWVVLVTSGYNNVAPGDGQGHLFVLNALTGALILDIPTGVGTTTTPSGLARINAQVVNPSTDSTIMQVYGGDLLGNLWRFDVNGNIGAPGFDAQLMVTLTGPTGTVQPITGKPEIGIVSGNTVVYVGTGRYLGITDLTDATQTSPNLQSIYGIKDPLTAGTTASVPLYASARATPGFVQQVLTSTTCPAGAASTICTTGQSVLTSTQKTVNFATGNGWFVDLLGSGERATNDPILQLGTLGFTTILPSVNACTVGGQSFSYFFDYRTGGAIANSVVGVVLGNALATRPVFVRLPNNAVVEVVRMSDGTTTTKNVPIPPSPTGSRRVSWRTLLTQ